MSDETSVYFATKNKGKFLEAKKIASGQGVRLIHLDWSKFEVQDNAISKIASIAAEAVARESGKKHVVAEDSGFFVTALQGFPGPYSSYVYDTLGVDGVLRLMRDVTLREASFSAAIAYSDGGQKSVCFEGTVKGTISETPRGSHGFGFDPIFIPENGYGRTFAEMGAEEKNQISHRAVGFGKFCKWFTSYQTKK